METAENPQTGSPDAGTGPWPTWTVWQYADDTNTTFSGVSPSCDVDVFNGTFTQLTNTLMIRTGITPPAAPATNNWDPAFLNASPESGGGSGNLEHQHRQLVVTRQRRYFLGDRGK